MRLTLPWPPSANRYWRNVKGRMILSAEARTYKATVGLMLNTSGIAPRTGPVCLRLDVYRPQRRGDLDNTLKCALDSLNGHVYIDDAQIVELHAFRHDDKANPRIEVQIE